MAKLIVQLINEAGYKIEESEFTFGGKSCLRQYEEEIMRNGCKVYMKWYKPTTGERGYWSPEGYTTKPYLYGDRHVI